MSIDNRTMTQLSFYRDKRFYISMCFAVLMTIVGFVISAATADFGFETYWGAMIFFPYEMLSTLYYGVIPVWVGVLSFFQFLPYGLLVWYCWRRQTWRLITILLLFHVTATGAAFWFIKYSKKNDGMILIQRFHR